MSKELLKETVAELHIKIYMKSLKEIDQKTLTRKDTLVIGKYLREILELAF